MMKKLYKKLSLTALILLFLTSAGLAQERVISGTVTDEDGAAMPGVNVLEKGTSNGTASDVNGNFKINIANDQSTLIFTFVGYANSEIVIGARSVLNIQLTPDVMTLTELVVTGYIVQEKKDLTSAVAVVSTKDLLSVAATSVEQQLQGRAAGVTVTTSNVPGQGANVRIRGLGTLGNNDPLYVIDGVPTTDNLANFNQNDIESIQILKDATSASIYGSRAGNGVIIITTKKGKAGQPKVTFDAYYGSQTPRKFLDLLNTQQYGDYLWASKRNAGVVNAGTKNPENGQYGNGVNPIIPDYIVPSGAFEGDPRVNPLNYSHARFLDDGSNNPAFGNSVFQITKANKQGTDWVKSIFETAPQTNYQLGISGGTDEAKYSISVGHFDQQSMLLYNSFKRTTLRVNTEFKVKKFIRIGENLQVLFAQRKGGFSNQSEDNQVSMAYRMQPIVPIYDIAGNFAGTLGNNLGNARNPVAQLTRAKDNGYNDLRVFGNVFAEVDILKDFKFRSSLGVDATVGRGKNATAPDPESSEAGRYYNFNADFNYRYSWTWTNTLNYKKVINDIHSINILIGTEAIKNFGEIQTASRERYATSDPTIPLSLRYIDSGNALFQNNGGRPTLDYTLFGYFGQLNYSLKNKYLFQATVRRDASSRFLVAQRYATFPAVSAGWRLSEEQFLQGSELISDLKIRAGWGQTGNQSGISDYNSYLTFNNDLGNGGYSLNGNANGYATPFVVNKFGNPNGKWETTTSTNIGFDLGLLKNALTVNFDWYNRQTDDVLLQLNLPWALGNATAPSYNVAAVRNRGIDLAINYSESFLNDELELSAGVIFSQYKNEVTTIDPINDDAFITGPGLRTPAVTRSIKGQPISSFYGYIVDGIFQNEEEAAAAPSFPGYNDATVFINGVAEKGTGKFKYRDVNGDGKISDADQTFIGSPHPKFTYGFNLSAAYKNFELTAFFQGVQGNDVFNYVRYWTDFNTFQGNRSVRVINDSWTPTNTGAKLPILDENDAISSRPSSYFVEDGSYLRMKNIQLAYNVPTSLISKIGLAKVRVYVQGQNLLTATKYSGLDPELSLRDNNNQQMGVDEGIFPTPKVFILGINLGF